MIEIPCEQCSYRSIGVTSSGTRINFYIQTLATVDEIVMVAGFPVVILLPSDARTFANEILRLVDNTEKIRKEVSDESSM